MKFHINVWFVKDKKVTQLGKNSIFGKEHGISLKIGFFEVLKKFIRLMCYFWVYMMQHRCLYDWVKTGCFGKICF